MAHKLDIDKIMEKLGNGTVIQSTLSIPYVQNFPLAPPLQSVTTISNPGLAGQLGISSAISVSGMTAPSFLFAEQIKFGFTITFKTDKAKLKKIWGTDIDYTQGTPVISNELKKIL